MPDAKRDRTGLVRVLKTLPTSEASAAAIKETARRLGLLLDLHRITARLRELDEPKR
jgi:hypothetical protein